MSHCVNLVHILLCLYHSRCMLSGEFCNIYIMPLLKMNAVQYLWTYFQCCFNIVNVFPAFLFKHYFVQILQSQGTLVIDWLLIVCSIHHVMHFLIFVGLITQTIDTWLPQWQFPFCLCSCNSSFVFLGFFYETKKLKMYDQNLPRLEELNIITGRQWSKSVFC